MGSQWLYGRCDIEPQARDVLEPDEDGLPGRGAFFNYDDVSNEKQGAYEQRGPGGAG